MQQLKLIKIILVVLFISTNIAFGVSLGELKLYSYLNEPLKAEITLTNVDDLDVNNILVELASPKDFMRSGIPRPFFLTKLKFKVIRNDNDTVINISTDKAVKNPFLDFLIQVVWPEGKIIKSYTILLDPATDDKKLKRDTPVSQRVSNSTLKKDLSVSDAIFATSLEDSTENEISSEQKKQIIAMADEFEATEPVATSELADSEQLDNEQNVETNNSVLDKISSSLQVFAQQSKKPKINYDKLLNLQPTSSSLHEDALPLAESLAMLQVNSELESLRHKNNEAVSPTNANNNVAVHTGNQSYKPEISNQYLYLDNIKKYGNDVLWACFLIASTIFLIHKMLQQNARASTDLLDATEEPFKAKKEKVFSYQKNFGEDINEEKLDELLTNPNLNVAINTIATRNEELELKIALIKQYLEAGDKNSARDILQDLSLATIKESKYKEQIEVLTKCFV